MASLRRSVDSELTKAKDSALAASKELDRVKELYPKKLRSEQELEQAELKLKLASEDLKAAQDTLANLWRQADAPPDDPVAYAFRAVRLNALKRRERRRLHAPLDAVADIAAPSGSGGAPTVDPLAMERAIERLPPPQQAVVRMRYYLGLSLAEVARALSISSNTAASRCRYALATLRRVLRHQ